MFVIYSVVNSVNGKIYIGLTSAGARERWAQHLRCARRGKDDSALMRAVRLYGAAAFSIEVMAEAIDRREACAIERGLIAQYGAMVPLGYNLTAGGEGAVASPETRAKMSLKHAGQKRGPMSAEQRSRLAEINTGKHHSPETRAKMSASRIGRKRPAEVGERISASKRGVPSGPLPEATKAAISAALTGRKKAPFSDAHRANLSAARRRFLDGQMPEAATRSVIDEVLSR